METPILKATTRLINSVWTLTYQLIDGKVKVLRYTRDDAEGYEREQELPRCSTIENPQGRILTHVRIGKYEPFKYWATDKDPIYEVLNPGHIFSYDK
jgi:hypothetical protein